jgi:NDP-sugar pyrophosphorylase family protein
MKAMILAAGLGTRLRPLTDDRPKALVTVAGRTLLEIALARLRAFGVREVIVNAHHYAEMIVEYLKANDNFGMRIEVSREEELLDTGGGLKMAAQFFIGSQEQFIVHNVDVISTIDLGRMMRFHTEENALATLAVQERESSRLLLFDEQGQLCGRAGRGSLSPTLRTATPRTKTYPWGPRQREGWGTQHSAEQAQVLGFCGIHVLSPQIFAKMIEEGAFSIIDTYLRLAAQGEKIVAFRVDDCYWRDLGKPESIVQAAADMSSGIYSAS